MTDPQATRFWMHVDEAVDLVLDTLANMRGGELVIPTLPAFQLFDLALAMGLTYRVTGLQPGEKMHESMRPGQSSADAPRLTVRELREKLEAVR